MTRFRHFAIVLSITLAIGAGRIADAQTYNNFEESTAYKNALRDLALDLQRELDLDPDDIDEQKLLKLMQKSGVNSCVMKLWRQSISSSASEKERYELAMRKTNDQLSRIELVENYLRDFGGDPDRRRQLAVRIARDAVTVEDLIDNVFPAFERYLGTEKSRYTDGLGLVEKIYSTDRFKSICQRVSEMERAKSNPSDYGSSILNRGNNDDRYSASKPPINAPAPQPIAQSQPVGTPPINDLIRNAQILLQRGQNVPARVVSSTSYLCQSAVMIKKCHEFTAQDSRSGRYQLFHGNLYADCKGYIMVTHQKR